MKKTEIELIPKEKVIEYQIEHDIRVEHLDCKEEDHNVIASFSQLQNKIPSKIFKYLQKYQSPTPIQAQCWAIAFEKKDLIAISETGSGKTLGFLIPILGMVSLKKERDETSKIVYPEVLVITPTRELAIQIGDTLNELLKPMKKQDYSMCLYGGVSRRIHVDELLKKRPSIIVSTPGRLEDLMRSDVISLSKISYCVLDEADRMFDAGFEPTIKQICGQMPVKGSKQMMMFSATWPSAVQKMALTYLEKPIAVFVGKFEKNIENDGCDDIHNLRGGSNIEQIVNVIDPKNKPRELEKFLKQYGDEEKIIVFALYKKEADRVEGHIRSMGKKVAGLHGDKTQEQRNKAINDFRKGVANILVATDVAARGLDIPSVTAVLNYTFPLTIEDYVHRIGRTGRAGIKGTAVTFFTENEKTLSGELILVLSNSGITPPNELVKFGVVIKQRTHNAYGSHYKKINPNVKGTHIKFD